MPRYELIQNGTIKSYYDEFVDCYQYYECAECNKGSRELSELRHSKKCKTPKKLKAMEKKFIRDEEKRKHILSKLTKKDIKFLGL